MSRYKSEQTTYNSLKKKYVPLWKLDTNIVTVTHFNADTQIEESKTYHTDFIILTANAPIGFAGSSTRVRSFSTLMI